MTSVIIVGVLFVALAAVVFFSKRRPGVPILALGAGVILSELWVGELTPMVARAGVQMTHPPLETVVAFIAVLVPALLVMLGGVKIHAVPARLLAGVLFACVAIAMLYEILGAALVIDGAGKGVFEFIGRYKVIIITFGLLVAVGDVMAIKMPKLHKKH